jgi:predicted Rossmann fold flavoprotein
MMAELVRLRYYLGMHKNQFSDRLWDVVVVGGGPAGMMAAGRAAELGATVLLLEKNPSLGVKLLITGGGRCNVTNVEPDLRKLLARYKGSDQFLFSAFAQYDNHQVVKFFHSREMPIKVENEGRAFPVSNSARSVWEVLVDYLKQGGVEVRYNSTAKELISEGNLLTAVRLADGSQIKGKKFIVAAGGSSRPETGSTGDGFKWLKTLGLRVAPVSRALVPIALKDAWVKKLQGVSLADIKLTVLLDGEKQSVKKGKLLFTHVGISGPTVLNMSRAVGELLPYGEVVILLDLLPQFDHGQLKEKLHFLLTSESNKKIKNSLAGIIPSALVPIVLDIAKIDAEKFSHSVSREERILLISLMKAIPMRVKELLGSDKAVVSSGGAELTEVNFKTMQSRLIPNLYIIGDMLNIDRPSGGYSLQLCWTTGFVAGSHAGGNQT